MVDPLAQEFAGWSGYNYVLGNPVSMIDKDGRAPDWINNGDGTYTAEDGDSAYSLAQQTGISNSAADHAVQSSKGANYTGSDGRIKSNVDVGDIVNIGNIIKSGSSIDIQSTSPSSNEFAGAPFAVGVATDAIGGLGTGMSMTGGSFGLSNSKGFAPKLYANGWGGNQHVKTRGMGSVGSTLGRIGTAGTLILGGVDIGLNAYSEGGYGQGTHTATLKTGGSLLFGSGSAYGLAAFGTLVGGPPGGLIGGIIGGIGGSYGGSKAGEKAAELLPVNEEK